jgi:hypothetical protein
MTLSIKVISKGLPLGILSRISMIVGFKRVMETGFNMSRFLIQLDKSKRELERGFSMNQSPILIDRFKRAIIRTREMVNLKEAIESLLDSTLIIEPQLESFQRPLAKEELLVKKKVRKDLWDTTSYLIDLFKRVILKDRKK